MYVSRTVGIWPYITDGGLGEIIFVDRSRRTASALPDPNGKPVAEKYASNFPVDGIWMDSKQYIYLSNLAAEFRFRA